MQIKAFNVESICIHVNTYTYVYMYLLVDYLVHLICRVKCHAINQDMKIELLSDAKQAHAEQQLRIKHASRLLYETIKEIMGKK